MKSLMEFLQLVVAATVFLITVFAFVLLVAIILVAGLLAFPLVVVAWVLTGFEVSYGPAEERTREREALDNPTCVDCRQDQRYCSCVPF